LFVDTSGNVGIGTTAPRYQLTVDGTASISDDFYVTGDDVLFRPYTNGTDSFVIASSGWVTGDDYGPLFNVNTTAASISMNGDLAVFKDFNVASGAIQHDYSSGITYIDSLNMGALSFDTDAGVVSWVDMPVATTAASIVESYTAQLDGNPMITVYGLTDGSGGVTSLGVGIGDTAPSYMLSVDGTASISDDFYIGNDSLIFDYSLDKFLSSSSWSVLGDFDIDGTASISIASLSQYAIFGDIATPSSPGLGMVFHDTGDNSLLYYDGTGWQNLASPSGAGTISGTGSSGYIAYWDGNTSLNYDSGLYWNSGSNYLGIGTISPDSSLDVVGQIIASSSYFGYASLSQDFQVGTNNLYVNVGSSSMDFLRASVSDSLTVSDILKGGILTDGTAIWTSGNLTGAGSLAFNYASVAQDFAVGNSLFYVNVGSQSYQFGGTGTASFAGPLNISGDIDINSGKFIFDNSGYFDIGQIATPSDSTGRIFHDADNSLLYYDGTGWQNLASAGGGISGGSQNYIGIWNGADSMTYDTEFYWDNTNNWLGIGDITPDAMLDVNGGASISQDFSVGDSLFYVNVGSSSVDMGAAGSDVYIGIETGSTTNLIVEGTGNLGIGDTNPGYRLSVDGTASASGNVYFSTLAGITDIDADGSGMLYSSSDLRLKKNVADIDNALSKLMTLRGVYYNWKTPEEGNDYIVMDGTVLHMGFIAQEVASSAVPDVAYTHNSDGGEVYAIRDSEILALTVEAIQEQQTQISDIYSALTIEALGNVGIAGTASISGDLYVGGLATESAAFVYVDTEGKLHAGDSYSDLSEFMPLASQSFEAGDVITSRPATDEEKANGLTIEPFIGVKATISYDQNLLGVVSYSDIPALGAKLNNNYLPISLAGRVPVKVSTENGAIKEGDYLTSSTLPGVAMKATNAGPVIGKALEPFPNDQTPMTNDQGYQTGKILMFVNSTWYGGESSEIVLNPDGTIDDKVTVETGGTGDFLANLTAGLRNLGVDIVDGVIKATQLVVNEVKTKVLRISVEQGKDATVGSATIPAQQIEFRVNNTLVEQDSKIFVSFTTDTGGRTWHISEKVPGVGFTIKLSDVTPEELSFDYWILQVEGSNEQGVGSDEQPTTPPTDSGYCGDNTVQPGEECDDGNLIDGDGCDATCITEIVSEEPPVEEPPVEEVTPPVEPVSNL